MTKSTFKRHPSISLNQLYAEKSYQGANPNDAKILFVGRDPNWAEDIENQEMFKYISEYLTDGVTFWQTYNIHHPFLLPTYKGDGKKYHRSFSKLELNSSVASKISFVELIGFPTTGMASSNQKLFKELLLSKENKENLTKLNTLVNDNSKIVFIAWGLIKDFKFLYKKTNLFETLANLDKSLMNRNDINQANNIYIHRHFSDSISNLMLEEMGKKVRNYLRI